MNFSKSRIAIEYCYRYRAKEPKADIFWVHASSHARFEEAYKDIARELTIPGHTDPNLDCLDLVVRYLSDDANGPWLLVIDNADDSEVFFCQKNHQPRSALVNYLPKSSNGSIIITTRDMRVGERLANRETPIPVLPLEMVDAQGLLKTKSRLNDEEENERDALELLETLNYLPLGITQAAAFISENDITVTDYVEMLQASDSDTKDLLEEDLHDAGRDTEIQNSVFQTWYLTFRHLSKQKPRAAELLSLMAFFHRQAIPAELLRNDNERKIDFVTAIGTLKAFSLISEEKSQSVFGIHRLVQLSIQRWLEIKNQILSWQEKALRVVAKCCPPHGEYEEWESWQKISAHIQTVLDYNLESCLRQRAEILNGFGSYDKSQGRYEEANKKVTKALAIHKDLLGENHIETLKSMHNLSSIFRSQGRLVEAEEMSSYVVQTWKQSLGPEHLDTLAAMNNLGLVYVDIYRDLEAEQLFRHVVKIGKRVLGSEHQKTLTCMHNLAYSIIRQGRLKEAEGILNEVIKLESTVLGLRHPDILKSMHVLVNNFYLQGRLEEAAKLGIQLLVVRTQLLTLEHPDTLISLQSLSVIHQDQGQFEAAEELQLLLIKTRARILGHEHSETLASSNGLALTYAYQGRWEEAETLNANVLGIQKRVLGLDHDNTLTTMHNIVFALLHQERWQEAADLGVQVVTARKRLWGQDNFQTIASMYTLAQSYKGLNRDEDAFKLMAPVAARWTEILGPEHPETQRATVLVSTWIRMRDNSAQEDANSGANTKTNSSVPEEVDFAKDPIPSPQDQLSKKPEHSPQRSCEPHPSSGDNRKETITESQGEPLEQTVHAPEDPHELVLARCSTLEESIPAHEMLPSDGSEQASAPVP